MLRSEQIQDLATALAKAQGRIEGATKDSTNPYFRSSYADLASVWNAIRQPLSANGLSVVQTVAVEGSDVTVTTLLLHESGQFISFDIKMIAQRQLKDGGGWEKIDTPQAIGSVITYARRYALQSLVGVAPEDDDGEAGSGRGQQPTQPPASQQRPPQGSRQAQQEVADKKLGSLIEDALTKLLARFKAVDAEQQFGEVMGAYGYLSIKDVPTNRDVAKRLVDDLKLRIDALEKK
jgi:hypothetical protein